MNKGFKTFTALLLALFMVFCAHAAFADETENTQQDIYEAEYIYVVNYKKDSQLEFAGQKVGRWGVFTPYKPRLMYDGELLGSGGTSISSFTMLDTRNQSIFHGYCADFDVNLVIANYARMNIEDSNYAAHCAGELRAIIDMGFFDEGDEVILGTAAGVEDLTVGEAICATQLAVWKTIHGDKFSVVSFANDITNSDERWTGYKENTYILPEYYDICYEEVASGYASVENLGKIRGNIEAAYNYLLSLEPVSAKEPSVSGDSFISWEIVSRELNSEGTYDITVNATTEVIEKEGDSLKLSAILGDKYAETELSNGVNNNTLVIRNVAKEYAFDTVKLAIDGTQTVKDVYIFDAEENRGSSQTIIAPYGMALPVHAEIDAVDEERIIKIHKLDKATKIGLEGIHFDIYYKGSLNDYLNGLYELDYKYSGYDNYVGTLITDENGYAEMNLTRNNLPDGVYLIVEQQHSAINAPVAPFYVFLPATTADGTGYEYVVEAYPKNEIKDEVEISKDVINIDNDEASLDAKKQHTWIITSSIPSDLENAKEYIISDTLDNRLNFLGNIKVQLEFKETEGAIGGGSIVVEMENSSGTLVNSTLSTILEEGVDYILKVTDNDSENGDKLSDSFTVSLTSSGMTNASALALKYDNAVIRVYFDAEINSNAQMATEIPNKAVLDYKNSVGVDYKEESDIPVVYTAGASILKIDADNQTVALKGAEFSVYRKAMEAEIADENIEKHLIGGMPEPMIAVEFFDNPELKGPKVTKAVSDENGNIYIYGLAYGEYYVVETKAPNGYNLLNEAKELTLNEISHLEGNALKVLNKSGAVLPETGGVGTTWFIAAGSLLSVAAAVVLVARRRTDKE